MSSVIILPNQNMYHSKPYFTENRRPYKQYKYADWDIKDVLKETLILKETDNNYLKSISKKYGIVIDTLKSKLSDYIKIGDESLGPS